MATMLSAGFDTTFEQLTTVLRKWQLVIAVVLVGSVIQPCSNSGPAFAAVGIAFDNDPEVLGAITAILVLQIVVGLVTASNWAKDADTTAEAEPAPSAA